MRTSHIAGLLAVILIAAGCSSTPTATSPPPSGSSTTAAPPPTITTTGAPEPTAATTTTLPQPTSGEISWRRVDVDTNAPYATGAVARGVSRFVAIGVNKPPGSAVQEALLVSDDGVTWDVTLEVGSRAQFRTITAWSGGFIAGGLTEDPTTRLGLPAVWTSADGFSWNQIVLTAPDLAGTALASGTGGARSAFLTAELIQYPGTVVNDIAEVDGSLLAVGYSLGSDGHHGAVWSSDDGQAWFPVSDQPSLAGEPDASMDRIVSIGDRVVVGGAVGGLITQAMWSSKDGGATWLRTAGERTPGAAPSSGHGTPLELAALGDQFVAVQTDIEGAVTAWVSSDGSSWTQTATLAESEAGVSALLPLWGVGVEGGAEDASRLLAIGGDWDGPATAWITDTSGAWFSVELPSTEFGPTEVPFTGVSWGENVLLFGADVGETYTPAQWFGSPAAASDVSHHVVLVARDDSLNVRVGAGTANDVAGTLGPLTRNVEPLPGRAVVSGSEWWEISAGDTAGWVNSFFLSVDAGVPSLDQATAMAQQLGEAFEAAADPSTVVSERGLFVVHFDSPRRYRPADLPGLMKSTATEVWPDGARDPEEIPPLTFAQAIGRPFAAAVANPDAILSVNERAPRSSWLIPAEFENFHYLAVHTPAPEGQPEDFAWATWHVFFDTEPDGLRVVGLMVDRWVP